MEMDRIEYILVYDNYVGKKYQEYLSFMAGKSNRVQGIEYILGRSIETIIIAKRIPSKTSQIFRSIYISLILGQ